MFKVDEGIPHLAPSLTDTLLLGLFKIKQALLYPATWLGCSCDSSLKGFNFIILLKQQVGKVKGIMCYN